MILDSFRLENQVAVVTGGTGLYGTPIARALGESGAHVIVTSRSAESAAATARKLQAEGLRSSGYPLDLGEPDSIQTFRDRLVADVGRVDVLVNNAVHRQGSDLRNTSASDWDATSRVNSRGLFLVLKHISEMMADAGHGSIINIGSIYGLVGPDFDVYRDTMLTMPAFYAYDKAGMVGLTRYLASALGPHGVRVNCLAPGGLFDGTQPEAFVAAYQARTALGRMATEQDVLGPLVLLASDAGAYITGVTLPVDGGWTAR